MSRRLVIAGIVCLLVWPAIEISASDRMEASGRAVSYLAGRQQDSGAFGSPDQPADMTADYLASLVAANAPRPILDRALAYIATRGPDSVKRAGHAGRIVSGLVAAGADPRSFAGTDYVARIQSYYDASTGSYDAGNLYANGLAVLGLVAAGETVPERAMNYLRVNACPGGGWSYAVACAATADTDSTAVVLSAVVGANADAGDETVERAVAWLKGAQRDDGGWGVDAGNTTNANSTSLAVSALAAVGETHSTLRRGVDVLMGLQLPSGGVRYTAGESKPNDYATAQSLVGLAMRAYPIRPSSGGASTEPPAAPAVSAVPTKNPRSLAAQTTPIPTSTPAPGSIRVALLVRSADWEHPLCPEVQEGSTGYDVLASSGLELEVQPFAQGTFVCSIEGKGCDVRSCTDCEPGTFWGYWTRDPGEESWTFSQVGSTERRPVHGSADAWVWGVDGGPPPPDELDADAICSAAPSAVTTASPRPTAEAGDRRSSGPLAAAVLAALVATLAGALVLRRRGSGT